MTESGRMAFLNSVVYASKFDHAPVLVRQIMSGRDRMVWMIGFIENSKATKSHSWSCSKVRNEEIKAAKEKAKVTPDQMTEAEKELLSATEWRVPKPDS